MKCPFVVSNGRDAVLPRIASEKARTIAAAVSKGNSSLLKFIDDEIAALAGERFFHNDYDKTLAPVYGTSVNPDTLVVEGGKI